MKPTAWKKSSYSGEETNCVEVGAAPGVIGVRDTKDRDGGTLRFSSTTWSGFVAALKARRYDG